MEYLLSCMAIAVKAVIGGFLWLLFILTLLVLGTICSWFWNNIVKEYWRDSRGLL